MSCPASPQLTTAVETPLPADDMASLVARGLDDFLLAAAAGEEEEMTEAEMAAQRERDRQIRERLKTKVDAHVGLVAQSIARQARRLQRRTVLDDEMDRTGFAGDRIDFINTFIHGAGVLVRNIPESMMDHRPLLANVDVAAQRAMLLMFLFAGKFGSPALLLTAHVLLNVFWSWVPSNWVLNLHAVLLVLTIALGHAPALVRWFPMAKAVCPSAGIHETSFRKYAAFFHVAYLSQMHLLLLVCVDRAGGGSGGGETCLSAVWWLLNLAVALALEDSTRSYALYRDALHLMILVAWSNIVALPLVVCLLVLGFILSGELWSTGRALVREMTTATTTATTADDDETTTGLSSRVALAQALVHLAAFGIVGTWSWTLDTWMDSTNSLFVSAAVILPALAYAFTVALESAPIQRRTYLQCLGCLALVSLAAWLQSARLIGILQLVVSWCLLAEPLVSMMIAPLPPAAHEEEEEDDEPAIAPIHVD